MIPEWAYLALCFALLMVPAFVQIRSANRKRDNFRAVEAERIARENATPWGNVDVQWWGE